MNGPYSLDDNSGPSRSLGIFGWMVMEARTECEDEGRRTAGEAESIGDKGSDLRHETGSLWGECARTGREGGQTSGADAPRDLRTTDGRAAKAASLALYDKIVGSEEVAEMKKVLHDIFHIRKNNSPPRVDVNEILKEYTDHDKNIGRLKEASTKVDIVERMFRSRMTTGNWSADLVSGSYGQDSEGNS